MVEKLVTNGGIGRVTDGGEGRYEGNDAVSGGEALVEVEERN